MPVKLKQPSGGAERDAGFRAAALDMPGMSRLGIAINCSRPGEVARIAAETGSPKIGKAAIDYLIASHEWERVRDACRESRLPELSRHAQEAAARLADDARKNGNWERVAEIALEGPAKAAVHAASLLCAGGKPGLLERVAECAQSPEAAAFARNALRKEA
jgi:hypothetical protein